MNKLKFQVGFASRRRHKAQDTVARFLTRSAVEDNAIAQFVLSIDEDTHDEYQTCIGWCRQVLGERGIEFILSVSPRDNKIGATNRSLVLSKDFDMFVMCQDDVYPSASWNRDIEEAFVGTDRNPRLSTVCTWDGYRGKNAHDTMVIAGKDHLAKFGYIYHPDYVSLFADNEYSDINRAMGVEIPGKDLILAHHWNGREDKLGEFNETFYSRDGMVYKHRKSRNFDLKEKGLL